MTLIPSRRARRVLTALSWAACAAANAQVINIPFKATFKSSVEIRGYVNDSSCLNVYTVPAGNKLRITDIALDSYGAAVSLPYQYVCTGRPACTVARTAYLTAPAGSTLVQNLTTGIFVNTGDTISVCNYSGRSRPTAWTFNAFLYTTP